MADRDSANDGEHSMKIDRPHYSAHDVRRFAEAIALGAFADQLFENICRSRGLSLAKCYEAPLYYLELATAMKRTGGKYGGH